MPQFPDFDPMDVGQIQPGVTYDFSEWLPPGVTLIGAPTLTVTPSPFNVDPDPQAIIVDGPNISTPLGKRASTGITVDLKGNVPAEYLLFVECPRSDGVGVATGFNHITVLEPS